MAGVSCELAYTMLSDTETFFGGWDKHKCHDCHSYGELSNILAFLKADEITIVSKIKK